MPATYDLRVSWAGDQNYGYATITGTFADAVAGAPDKNSFITSTTAAAAITVGASVQVYLPNGTIKYPAVYTVASKVTAGSNIDINVTPAFPTTTDVADRLYVVTLTSSNIDNVTQRRLDNALSIAYGRDTPRALSPVSPGTATFSLTNDSADYSPDNTGSAVAAGGGQVSPRRPVRLTATLAGTTYPVYLGFTDDYTANFARPYRTIDATCSDALAGLQEQDIYTPVYTAVRTGDAVHAVLDAASWPREFRDVDPGASVLPYWWEDGTNALNALQKLVQAEGMPALFTISPDGLFTFRDRHHRLFYPASVTSQATFSDASGAAVKLSLPLTYDAGWKDIINSVTVSVDHHLATYPIQVMWSSDATYTISDGETIQLTAQGNETFISAQVPQAGIDYVLASGTVNVSLSRDSGDTITISIQATGGPAVVQGMQVQAYPLTTLYTRNINVEDPVSIDKYHGRKTGGSALDIPFVNEYDAQAIAQTIVAHRAERRPVIQVILTNATDANLAQILSRDLSDRITINCAYASITNTDYYIERIEHAITGRAPYIHTCTFYCERAPVIPANQFRFGVTGVGFNQGTFAATGVDDPATVFVFDTAGHGFDQGVFAT